MFKWTLGITVHKVAKNQNFDICVLSVFVCFGILSLDLRKLHEQIFMEIDKYLQERLTSNYNFTYTIQTNGFC